MNRTDAPAIDHSILVSHPAFAGGAADTVRVTGDTVKKSNRYGQTYFHTVIEDVETGKRVSHSKSTIKTYYRCSCGRVAFHKVAN